MPLTPSEYRPPPPEPKKRKKKKQKVYKDGSVQLELPLEEATQGDQEIHAGR